MAKDLKPMPYKDIASAALSSCETLLNRWLPSGKKAGHEYQSTNPNRADANVGSFSININTGAWGDFATNDAGNDLISLYAYLHGIEQWEAAIEVADQIAYKIPDECIPAKRAAAPRQRPVVDPATVKPSKPTEPNHWHPVTPVPSNASNAPVAHTVRGMPAMKWEYKDENGQCLGFVFRFNKSDGGKETIPLTYCQHAISKKYDWRWMQWTAPNRPLYGLDRLAAAPDAWVLLVEGEKCADAPLGMTKGVPVSWPGGSKAVDKIDLSPLAGRKIYAWADCDAQREKLSKDEVAAGVDPNSKPLLPEDEQPGMKAMLKIREKLLALDPTTEFLIVDIPKPLEKPEGWDVADAISEGMDTSALRDFVLNVRVDEVEDATNLATAIAGGKKNTKTKKKSSSADAEKGESEADEEDDSPKWQRYLLRKDRGEIVACLANIVDILENDERWAGVIAYDEFCGRVTKLKKPPYWNGNGTIGEWDAQDDARTAMWLTKIYRFSPSANLVAEAVEVLSRANAINPPKEWMNSLQWDGTHRVDRWMLDFMGVPLTEYTKRVARWFFMGMVKRVFEPGCKFDYCLVLEGAQGRKKSSILEVIGGEWYGDTDLDLHNKDSMASLQGKMLYEFSEMGSVAKAEATKQKSFLSRKVDEYRPVYGRRNIKAPRQVIFSGTTNEWEWNKDPTGGRRFWPISVDVEVDSAGLKEARDQLFAEAVVMVNKGLRYWPTTEEQKELFDPEQLSRRTYDSFIDAVAEFVGKATAPFTLFYVLDEILKIPLQNHTRDIQSRVGIAFRDLGCRRIERRGDAISRFWYEPPEANKTGQAAGNLTGDGDDPLEF